MTPNPLFQRTASAAAELKCLDRIKPLALLLVAFISVSVYAETFDDRVRIAKDAETMELYKPYLQLVYQEIGNHLAKTMKACFEKVDQPRTETFTLVADVTPEGVARSVEVSPETNIATCFADGLRSVSFPRPPALSGRDTFPITIEMRMKP